jgi:hypothetical protein
MAQPETRLGTKISFTTVVEQGSAPVGTETVGFEVRQGWMQPKHVKILEEKLKPAINKVLEEMAQLFNTEE